MEGRPKGLPTADQAMCVPLGFLCRSGECTESLLGSSGLLLDDDNNSTSSRRGKYRIMFLCRYQVPGIQFLGTQQLGTRSRGIYCLYHAGLNRNFVFIQKQYHQVRIRGTWHQVPTHQVQVPPVDQPTYARYHGGTCTRLIFHLLFIKILLFTSTMGTCFSELFIVTVLSIQRLDSRVHPVSVLIPHPTYIAGHERQ